MPCILWLYSESDVLFIFELRTLCIYGRKRAAFILIWMFVYMWVSNAVCWSGLCVLLLLCLFGSWKSARDWRVDHQMRLKSWPSSDWSLQMRIKCWNIAMYYFKCKINTKHFIAIINSWNLLISTRSPSNNLHTDLYLV